MMFALQTAAWRQYIRHTLAVLVILSVLIEGGQCQCSSMIVQLTAYPNASYLTSPNYPGSYYNNLECHWRLVAHNSSYAIKIETIDLQIESQSSCWYDYLKIYDGATRSDPLLGKHCGKSAPTYVSTGSSLYIHFSTDTSVQDRGFKIKYYSGDRALLAIEEDDEVNVTAIVAGVIGGLIGLIIIVTVVVFCISAKAGKPQRSVHPRGTRIQSNTRRSHRQRRQQSSNALSMHQYPPGYVGPPIDYPDWHDGTAYGGFIPPTSPPPPYSATDPYLEANTSAAVTVQTTSLNSAAITSAPPLSQQQPQ